MSLPMLHGILFLGYSLNPNHIAAVVVGGIPTQHSTRLSLDPSILQTHPDDTDLKILVIDENPIRRAILEDGLAEAGFLNVTMLANTTGLLQEIYRLDPDVILIDLENPSRDVLEQMFQMSRIVRRPIAMFVDQSDRASIEAAIGAGVSAYIVDGLKKERLRPLLEMTVSRFRAFDKLRSELEEAKSALKDRKVIERAKGILMTTRAIDEEAAFALLRSTAMSRSKRIAEIAAELVHAYDLLNNGGKG